MLEPVQQCNRCKKLKYCYRLHSNPSIIWKAVNKPTDITYYNVCFDCLTPDELIKLLAPIALFTLEQVYTSTDCGIDYDCLFAHLKYTVGVRGNLKGAVKSLLKGV